MENLKFDYLRIRGDISIEPVARIPYGTIAFLIVGPTGAGKSTFIEALAGGSQNVAISSNQLAGFTQRVTAYKLINVTWGDDPICLVDTPGFSDSKISEIEIVKMLRDWLDKHCAASWFVVLFITPITITRMTGSRQRTIKMLKGSLPGPLQVSVVTTMWDTLHSDQTRMRAENNFEQLRVEIFNEILGEHTRLKRFMGTRTSALQVMNGSSTCGNMNPPFQSSTQASFTHLYRDLHERIEGALQKKVMIESDLAHSDGQTNEELKDILERNQKENNEILAKFISQLVKFGQPPHEFREGAQALRKTIVDIIVPADHQMHDSFQKWAKNPGIRNGLGADPKLNETILAILREEHVSCEHQAVGHRPSSKLDFHGRFRRLLKSTKIHRPKWLKRGE